MKEIQQRWRQERSQQQVSDWTEMISGEAGFENVARRRGFLDGYRDAKGTIGGDELRRKLTRDLFVQDFTGATPDELSSGIPQLRIAEKLGLKDADDAAFDGKIREHVAKEIHYRETAEKIYGISSKAALQGSGWYRARLEAQRVAGADWFDYEPFFNRGFADIDEHFSTDDIKFIDQGWRLVGDLDGKPVGNTAVGADMYESFADYGRRTPKEREHLLNGIGLRAAAEGEDIEGFFGRMGQALWSGGLGLVSGVNSNQSRTIADQVDWVLKEGRVLEHIPQIDRAYIQGLSHLRAEEMLGKPEISGLSEFSSVEEMHGNKGKPEISGVSEFSSLEEMRRGVRVEARKYRDLTAQERAALRQHADVARGEAAFLQDIRSGGIKALRYRDNEMTGNRGTVKDLVMGAAESLPHMAATALPYGIGLPFTISSYGEQEFNRLQHESPDADPATLERAAYLNALLKVGLDRVEIKVLRARMPKFSALAMRAGRIAGPPLVFAGRALAIGAFETVQEVAQDATDPLVQAAASALAEDVRSPDLERWLIREQEALGEIAGVSMIFGFIGGASTTITDYMAAPKLRESLMDRSGLRLSGIPESDALRISAMAEKNPAAAAQLLRASMMDTPMAVRREVSRAEVESLQLGQLNTRLRDAGLPEMIREDSRNVIVRYGDDTTPDRSFSSVQEAAEEIDSHLRGKDIDLTRTNRELFDLLAGSYAKLGDLELQGTVKPGRIPLAELVSQNPAMLDAARQRARIHYRQAEGEMGLSEATDEVIDSKLAELFVLGSSRNEFAGGVTRIVAQIAADANPLTVLEESIEGLGKYLMERRGVTRETMTRWIRETEAVTRTAILAKDFDSLDEARQYQELIEGWSRIGVAHATGRYQDSQLAGPVRNFFRSLKEILGQVLRLATAMKHFAATGGMDAEMRQWLDVAAGFEGESGVSVEGDASRDGAVEATERAGGGTTFSLGESPGRQAGNLNEAKAAAQEFISQPIVNDDDHLIATVSGRSIGKMTSAKAAIKSISSEAHAYAVANLDTLFRKAIRTHSGPDAKGDPNIAAMHRYYVPFLSNGEVILAKLTVKEFARKSEGNRIYSVEAVDVVKPAREWTASISEDRRNYVPQAGFEKKLQQRIEEVKKVTVADPLNEHQALLRPLPDPKKLGGLIDGDSDVSLSIGPESLSGDSEARIQEATEVARQKVGGMDGEAIRRAGRFWLSLHGEKGVSQFPELHGKTIDELTEEARAVMPSLRASSFGMIGDAATTLIEDGTGHAFIMAGPTSVQVNTAGAGGPDSYGSPGKHENRVKASMSRAVYQIAQAYARNNGLKFIQDDSVSAIATFRRWPQQLSSAIRMGDTSHIGGTEDVDGWKEGDHEHNAGLLAMHEYEYVRHFFPEIDGLHLSEDSATIIDHAGAPVPDQTLRNLLAGERDPRALGVGETTLRRAIVTGQTAAEGRMEPQSKAAGRVHGERRIHPGAVENFTPDLGSGDQGLNPPKHALSGISYSVGSDPSSDPNSSNHPHHPQHDEEGRMVPGNGPQQEVSGRSEEESRRRIRETLARRERGEGEGDLGNGAESVVIAIDDDEVLKDVRRSGVIRFNSDGEFINDWSLQAAEEKAEVINALGGMKTRVISFEGRMLFIQQRGTPISETDYLSIELPFGIEPSRHGAYRIEVNGEDYLISDLKPENFVKDSQGNVRLIDLITGKVAKGSTPK